MHRTERYMYFVLNPPNYYLLNLCRPSTVAFSLSLARSLMLRMILYECVFVCVFVGCIMFGIVFIVLFEQYTLSNLCFTFLLISSLFKTQVDVHFAGLWFKLFVFVYPRGTFVCVSLVCICDVRIFCCCYSVIQIITNKYSLSLSVLQFDSTSFTLLGNGAPTHKKIILKPRSECSFVCALLLP